ncbi:hypothetical protein NMY22_g3654 [Coprinellus aureogranulatus]|nr:hypothetical protein NMY22_g3654 [Coprinellus aureogranulatus]
MSAFSIAETVPVVGGPLKGALEGLCKVLKLVEQKYQNADGVAKLAQRLTALIDMLSNAEAPDCVLLQLIHRLNAVEEQLKCALSKQGIRYTAVSQILAGCSSEINDCLLDFTAITQMHILRAMRIQESERLALEFVTIFDPFGEPQRILKADLGNIEFVAMIISNRYRHDFNKKQALDRFISGGLYELTIDDGSFIEAMSDIHLSCVSPGTTLAMSVLVIINLRAQDDLRCPLCNHALRDFSNTRSICMTCDRRVSALRTSEETSIEGDASTTTIQSATDLFRHVTVKHRTKPAPERADELGDESSIVDGMGTGILTSNYIQWDINTVEGEEKVQPHSISQNELFQDATSTPRRRKRGARRRQNNREEVDFLNQLAVASQALARELERHSKLNSQASPNSMGPQSRHPT